ncbi:uncharacterized protein [Nicotiana sylvestris]|uniref:uncharacterized protein n=1 Tax=Nicotiana sylvestris TaxID=4096 RepID=UPI00388C557E
MAALPNFEEGQSTYRPPRFNGQYYGWWKTRMHDFIMAEDSELWDVICDGPHIPMKKLGETGPMVLKNRKEYSDINRKAIEKNFRAKKILESKVNVITKAKDLQTLTMDELIGNLKTYEMKRQRDSERREPKKEKNLVLKAENNDSSEEDSDMDYLTKRFQKMEHYKQNSNKAPKRNPVHDKRFSQKSAADNVVKQALAAWGDSSSESEGELDVEKSYMMAVEHEVKEYDSLFALMAQSDDDEEDDNDEVSFRDVKRNLKSYSSKKLMSLANFLIDVYYSLINDKDVLTIKLGDAKQSRDDLVVCVADLNETIANLEKEKKALTEKINSVENERDDLMVVVVDLKKTIENLSKEKNALEEKIPDTEQAMDDFLVVITDLEETIQGLKSEHMHWTWSSDVVTTMYLNTSGNRLGIGFQKEKTPYNPHIKYVIVPDNWLCTHCGNNGHFKENFQARVQSVQKNKVFAEKGIVRGSELQWTMDSGCSKHMTASTMDFLLRKPYRKGMYPLKKRGNKVEFLSKLCTVTNPVTGEVVLVAKRYKNIYIADFESLQAGDMRCLKLVDDDTELGIEDWGMQASHF